MKTSQLSAWPLNSGCQFDTLWPLFAKSFCHLPWLPKWSKLRGVPQFFITIRPHLKIENQMCLWGFFPQIVENVLTTTNRNQSIAQSNWIHFDPHYSVLEHYCWGPKSEALTCHRWIHESYGVMSFSVWQMFENKLGMSSLFATN